MDENNFILNKIWIEYNLVFNLKNKIFAASLSFLHTTHKNLE